MTDFIYKFEATGNDFLIVDAKSDLASSFWAERLCDRRFGIGADGILVFDSSKAPKTKMTIYNADGTRPEMCGNGVRCVSAFMDLVQQVEFPITVDTDAGHKEVRKLVTDEGRIRYSVDMGRPGVNTNPIFVPYRDGDVVLHSVSMGNPHAVCFDSKYFNDRDLLSLGKLLNDHHPNFPNGVNLEIVDVDSGLDTLKVRVYERGVGETRACGTGACAVVVAAILNNIVAFEPQLVKLPGGLLEIDWDIDPGETHEHVFMAGVAHYVAKLEIADEWIARQVL